MCVEGEHQGGCGEGGDSNGRAECAKAGSKTSHNAAQPTAHGAKPPNWALRHIEKRRKTLASFHPPSLPQLQ